MGALWLAELDLWREFQPKHGECDFAQWLAELDLWTPLQAKHGQHDSAQWLVTSDLPNDCKDNLTLPTSFFNQSMDDVIDSAEWLAELDLLLGYLPNLGHYASPQCLAELD